MGNHRHHSTATLHHHHSTTRHRRHHRHPLLHFLSAFLLISALPVGISEIKNMRIVDDSRPTILFENFGFSRGGRVLVSVKDVSWKSKRERDSEFDPNLMGFVLIRESSYALISNESQQAAARGGFCPLSSRYVNVMLKFESLAVDSTYNATAAIDDPDEYSLLFSNCLPGFHVTMDVHTEMYNVDAAGKKNFLPVGQTPLPGLYAGYFLVYAAAAAAWVVVCVRQRATVERIHVVMGLLLLFKALKLVCAAEDTAHVRLTGTPHGWDVAFYVFGFFKGITLFTVIVLIGTGWSFLKPYLQEREKKVLMVVIPMQVIENLASVVIGETGPAEKDWLTWNQIFLLVDIVCCCTVFFPIIWSIRSLREASKTDGKAARNLAKLTLFRHFYIVVVGYLYFTRIVVPALGALLTYRFRWVTTTLVEGASLTFYLFIFYNFQPIEKNPYLFIDDNEEATAAEMLEDDEFEL